MDRADRPRGAGGSLTVASIYDLFDRTPEVPPTPPLHIADDLGPYVQRVLDNVTATPEGMRNDRLHHAAYTLGRIVAAGQLDGPEIAARLLQAGMACGLTESEAKPAIRSSMQVGAATPRALDTRPGRDDIWDLNGSSSAPRTATAGSTTAGDAGVSAAGTAADGHTSWWPRDLECILAGHEPEQPPTHLLRDDGRPLFYPGSINGLLGESESGKSWVAQMLVAQRLAAGMRVAYLDFEDMAKNVVARLRALGATDQQLVDGFIYISPDETLHPKADEDLRITLNALPDTIIVDGFNAAMTLLGLKLESNVDVTVFFQRFLRPLAAAGACVVYIDHVPKDKENRGKGGIGAQAKRAMTSGTALLVEVVKPFGRGMRGLLSLTIDKDRPGHVRGGSGGARAGMVHIDSTADGMSVAMNVEAPEGRETADGGRVVFRPTVLMQRVSQFLETMPDGASKNVIENGVTGKAIGIRMALDCLVGEGYAVREQSGSLLVTKIVRAFREADDDPLGTTSSPSSPPRPTSSRDDAYETSSPSSPTPSRAGVTRDEDEGGPDEPWLPTSSPSPTVNRQTGEIT